MTPIRLFSLLIQRDPLKTLEFVKLNIIEVSYYADSDSYLFKLGDYIVRLTRIAVEYYYYGDLLNDFEQHLS